MKRFLGFLLALVGLSLIRLIDASAFPSLLFQELAFASACFVMVFGFFFLFPHPMPFRLWSVAGILLLLVVLSFVPGFFFGAL